MPTLKGIWLIVLVKNTFVLSAMSVHICSKTSAAKTSYINYASTTDYQSRWPISWKFFYSRPDNIFIQIGAKRRCCCCLPPPYYLNAVRQTYANNPTNIIRCVIYFCKNEVAWDNINFAESGNYNHRRKLLFCLRLKIVLVEFSPASVSPPVLFALFDLSHVHSICWQKLHLLRFCAPALVLRPVVAYGSELCP